MIIKLWFDEKFYLYYLIFLLIHLHQCCSNSITIQINHRLIFWFLAETSIGDEIVNNIKCNILIPPRKKTHFFFFFLFKNWLGELESNWASRSKSFMISKTIKYCHHTRIEFQINIFLIIFDFSSYLFLNIKKIKYIYLYYFV